MTSGDVGSQAKPRVIVTTDPELDDLNSMLRLVLYSNEIDIAALVYSSSQFHHEGDPERGIAAHRWPPEGARGHIDEAVDAYEAVYPNLRIHDPRYPRPEHLRSLVAEGNVLDVGDTRLPTPGSELVKQVLLGDAPGQIFAQAWGGTNTIARALMSIEEEFAGTDRWDEIYELIVGRTVITAFAEQDDTFADYIRPRWPDLEFRDVATMAWGYFAWFVVPPGDEEYLSAEWMRENVSSQGPLGAAYRVWGDGLQMAEGFDAEDYFGVPDATVEGLAAAGYRVWAPLKPNGSWISEGDTSNYALMIDNGLRNWEHPTYGGWGGRQERDVTDPCKWVSVDRAEPRAGGLVTDWGDVGRWVSAFQRDLAARLRWSISESYEGANHHPVVRVPGGLARSVAPGGTVRIAWETEDPDGDAVSVRVWQYVEAGTGPVVAIVSAGEGAADVTVPATASGGQTVHLIVEATDDGEPPLTSYARVIVTVR